MKNLITLTVVMFIVQLSHAQWQPDVRLTNDTAESYTNGANAWSIATNGDTVHLIWQDARDGNEEIYYKRSVDQGISWGPDIRLTNDADSSKLQSITVSGSIVQIVWQDKRDGNNEIYYKRSTDNGSTWEADMRLTNDAAGSWNPSAAVSGSNIYVVWEEYRDGNGEVYFKSSNNLGLNWGPDIRLTNSTGLSEYPCIAVSDSTIHVFWDDRRDGNNEIYYKHSSDGGLNWEPDTRLTNESHYSYVACAATRDSIVHIVWYDNRDANFEIYYKRSSDNGLSWDADTRLTNHTSYSLTPSIALSGSIVHVVWEDGRDAANNSEVYYKRSENDGISWGPDTRLTNAAYMSYYPTVAVTDSVLHIFWTDQRDLNDEVYYKRNPTGALPVGINDDPSINLPEQIHIYPNPASCTIQIDFSDLSIFKNGMANEELTLVIRNILGEIVLTKPIQDYQTNLNVSVFPCGLYFLNVTNNYQHFNSAKLNITR